MEWGEKHTTTWQQLVADTLPNSIFMSFYSSPDVLKLLERWGRLGGWHRAREVRWRCCMTWKGKVQGRHFKNNGCCCCAASDLAAHQHIYQQQQSVWHIDNRAKLENWNFTFRTDMIHIFLDTVWRLYPQDIIIIYVIPKHRVSWIFLEKH